MNTKQKVLTGIGLLAFVISAANAPWEVVDYDLGTPYSRSVGTYPIWGPSYYGSNRTYTLQLLPLVGVWAVIGVVYAGLFFMLKTGSKEKKP